MSEESTVPPKTNELAPDNRSEPLRMPSRKEMILFACFGLIPIVAIYLFALHAKDDVQGAAFEQERRLQIAACMAQLDDREQCRDIIDEPLIVCYEARALPDGTIADRLDLQKCLTRRDDDKFRVSDPDKE